MCIVIINIIFVAIILSTFITIIFKVSNSCITLDIFTKTSCLLRISLLYSFMGGIKLVKQMKKQLGKSEMNMDFFSS